MASAKEQGARPASGRRRALLAALSALVATVASLGIAEIALRLLKPPNVIDYWSPPAAVRNEPTTNEPDPVLGWRPRPGRYVLPAYAPGEPDVEITILEHGERRTGRASPELTREPVLAVGDSLTFGWAIADEETFAWKLQARHPGVEFVNLGVIGYGTYQTLLRTQRFISETGAQPRHVLYQLVDEHPPRNVGSLAWLRILSRFARRGHVALPYCLPGAGPWEIRCFPPEAYPQWPLDRRSHLVNLLKTSYLAALEQRRRWQEQRVTFSLIRRMQAELAASGAVLHVVIVWMDDDLRRFYAQELAEAGIPYADCVNSERETDRMRVPGEGHPNGRLNDFLAECIGDYLRPHLAPLPQARESSP